MTCRVCGGRAHLIIRITLAVLVGPLLWGLALAGAAADWRPDPAVVLSAAKDPRLAATADASPAAQHDSRGAARNAAKVSASQASAKQQRCTAAIAAADSAPSAVMRHSLTAPS